MAADALNPQWMTTGCHQLCGRCGEQISGIAQIPPGEAVAVTIAEAIADAKDRFATLMRDHMEEHEQS